MFYLGETVPGLMPLSRHVIVDLSSDITDFLTKVSR